MLNILKKIIKISLIVITFFALQNNLVNAQIIDTTTLQANTLNIGMSPENPKDNDNVTLTLSSYSLNLDTSKITWYVDNVVKKDGIGITSLIVQAKDSGQNTTVKAVVVTSDGATFQATQDIKPAGVDLITEPTGYTPPFYKGKSLFVTQGITRIIAIPDVSINGKKVDSKNLIFRWSKDGAYLINNSGMGKDSVTVEGTVPIRDIEVSVEVIDSSGNTVAQNSVLITVNNPGILFYEDNPLYGILYNKAIMADYYLGTREEVDVIAKPFFFNLSSDAGSDSTYNWTINSNAVTLSGKPNELVLKQQTTNLAGTASVSLTLNNKIRIFQYSTSGFNVDFGQ